jgi:hypothetical protein
MALYAVGSFAQIHSDIIAHADHGITIQAVFLSDSLNAQFVTIQVGNDAVAVRRDAGDAGSRSRFIGALVVVVDWH